MLPNWLSYIDIAYVAIALLFAWGGAQKGFAAQLSYILTFLMLGVVMLFAYPALFEYLGRVFRQLDQLYLRWLLLAGVFVLAIGIFTLISKLLAGVIKTHVSPRADAGYGFALGFIRGALSVLFAMVLFVMLDSSGKVYDKLRMKSVVGKFVCLDLMPRIQPHLISTYEHKIQDWKNKLLEQEDAGVLE